MAFIPFPAGTVLAYAGATAPSGWLMCDGTAYSQADYPDAYAVLGVTYNTQTNPTTGSAYSAPSAGQFRVPDYRGIFLRAVGTASGKDATSLGGYQTEKTNRPASAFTTAASAVSGSSGSMSANTTHGHGFSDPGHTHPLGVTLGQGNAFTDNSIAFAGAVQTSNTAYTRNDGPSIWKSGSWMQTVGTGSSVQTSGSIDHTHGLSTGTAAASSVTGGGDNETRPLNRGVNYIIKI